MLTSEQQTAVDWEKGVSFLSASAGAGKTSVLVQRYSRLLNSGIDPKSILAITFTNKAAKEIKERAVLACPNINPKDMHVFTFHGLCNYWLRKLGKIVNWPKYQIIMPSDTEKMLNMFSATKSILGDPSRLDYETSKLKKKKLSLLYKALKVIDSEWGVTLKEVAKIVSADPNEEAFVISCIAAYWKLKRSQKKMDFCDLQIFGIKLLQDSQFKHEYEYVMADEYQDSNDMNFQLIKTVGSQGNIMAIGDRKQAIYGFRGSSSSCVEDFINYYKATELFLTKNFRSHKSIVDLANDSVPRDAEKMVSNSEQEGKVAYYEFRDQDEELKWLANSLNKLAGL